MRTMTARTCVCLLTLGALMACQSEPKQLAPEVSTLSSAAPISERARTFALDAEKSGIKFSMDAELEQISGRAPGSAQGELSIHLENLGESNGLVKVDLDQLSVYKRTRDDDVSEFGTEEKNEKQNRDMRNWFQIGADAPADDREKYRWAEFKITSLEATPNDVTSLEGATRKVTALVSGDFRLHGRVMKKTLATELTFSFDGDKPTGVSISTTSPFDVGLEEHDVKPRKSFAELADATLEVLGHKVSKVAKVSLAAHATAK